MTALLTERGEGVYEMTRPFTVAELAKRWRVSQNTILAELHAKTLDGFQIGRAWRIPGAAVKERETCQKSGSNSIEDTGVPSGPKTARRDGDRYAPKIVSLPSRL